MYLNPAGRKLVCRCFASISVPSCEPNEPVPPANEAEYATNVAPILGSISNPLIPSSCPVCKYNGNNQINNLAQCSCSWCCMNQ